LDKYCIHNGLPKLQKWTKKWNCNLTNYGQNKVHKYTPGLGGLTQRVAEIYSIFRILKNFSCFCNKNKNKKLYIFRNLAARQDPPTP
jgi:hypothetical protein